MRLKGNGSFRTLREEASFKLNLDRYVEDQELAGLDELTLDNDVSDPSGIRRRLAHERYRAAGVPAPRTVHVQTWLNGHWHGIGSLSEGVDGRFLDRWFGDGDGPLYEIFDADFGEEVPPFDHDNGPEDPEGLLAIGRLMDNGPFTQVAHRHLDVDAWIRFFATSAVLGHFDAYPYTTDDLFVYRDPGTGLWAPIPHGTDETFGDPQRPVTVMRGRLGQWCMEDPACVLRFADALWTQVELLEDDHTHARACALAEEVRALDPTLSRCTGPLGDRIASRRRTLEAQASLPGPR